MQWTIQKVGERLGDKLIGNAFMREQVCTTLLLLPSAMVEKVCKTVWFISSPEDAWAFTFRGEDLKHRHLIFLSEDLFRQDESQIFYTILHEIGHVLLNHRNSIGVTQTESEIHTQEEEADTFAKKYTLELH